MCLHRWRRPIILLNIPPPSLQPLATVRKCLGARTRPRPFPPPRPAWHCPSTCDLRWTRWRPSARGGGATSRHAPLATAGESGHALRERAGRRIRAGHFSGDGTGGLENVAFRARELPAFAAVEAGAFGDDAAPTNHARFADDLIGAVPLIA